MLSDLATAITQFLDAYGLIAIFVVMLLKEIGIPVPIPGDLIMLAAAAQAAIGKIDLLQAFGAILLAMVVGAWIQYLLVRLLGRPFLYRFGRYVGLTEERLDRVAETIRRGGVPAISVSLVTPGVRIATVPACGLAELPYRSFFTGVIVGSGVFLALHFVIGYVGGPLVNAVMSVINMPMLALIVAFFLVGLAGWMLIRRRKQGETVTAVEWLGDWADASCPICLFVGAVNYRRP